MGDESWGSAVGDGVPVSAGADVSADQQVQQLAEEFGRGYNLSPQQSQLVQLAVAGLHRKEVAARLACSLKTIEGYWKRIYEKTGCASEAEVVSKFIREKLCAERSTANDT